MKSTTVKQSELEEKWYLVDLDGVRIGRAASVIAELLQGKNNPRTRAYLDPKVKVVAVNSGKIDFSAKRAFTKFYKRYSGFPGGLSHRSLEETFEKNKLFPIEKAVKGMLPKTKRGSTMIANLKVFEGSEHKHEAQTPEKIDLKTFKL